MLTERPEIQADTPGHPSTPVRQGIPVMANCETMTLLAAKNGLVTIASLIAAVEDATLVDSGSITKAKIGMTLAGVVANTKITTAHHLAALTNTEIAICRRRVLPISGSAAEMPSPHIPPATDRMTAAAEANLIMTTMAIQKSMRETAAGLHVADTKEAKEIGVALAEIKN